MTQHCQCHAFEVRTCNVYDTVNYSNVITLFGYDADVPDTKYFFSHN